MLAKFSKSSVGISMKDIDHSDLARNIGTTFDNTLEMKEQVGQICKPAWGHIRNLAKIRPTAEKFIHCFLSTKLDYLKLCCLACQNGI